MSKFIHETEATILDTFLSRESLRLTHGFRSFVPQQEKCKWLFDRTEGCFDFSPVAVLTFLYFRYSPHPFDPYVLVISLCLLYLHIPFYFYFLNATKPPDGSTHLLPPVQRIFFHSGLMFLSSLFDSLLSRSWHFS